MRYKIFSQIFWVCTRHIYLNTRCLHLDYVYSSSVTCNAKASNVLSSVSSRNIHSILKTTHRALFCEVCNFHDGSIVQAWFYFLQVCIRYHQITMHINDTTHEHQGSSNEKLQSIPCNLCVIWQGGIHLRYLIHITHIIGPCVSWVRWSWSRNIM